MTFLIFSPRDIPMILTLLLIQIFQYANGISPSDPSENLPSAAVKNRFCVHVSGVLEAECRDDICVSPVGQTLGQLCDKYTLKFYAAEFERIRKRIRWNAATVPIHRSLFDAAEQLLATNYEEFLMIRNTNRVLRGDIDYLFSFVDSPAEAIVSLTQLFLRVPGSNWVISYDESEIHEWTTQFLTRFLLPAVEPFENLYTRRIMESHTFNDVASVIMEYIFTTTNERLLLAWALSTAKRFIRFTDDEEEVYSKVLLKGFRDIELLVESNPYSVHGEIAHWLYSLITRSSILLQTPLMRTLKQQFLINSNSRYPNVNSLFDDDAHWFTRPLVSALPEISWEEPVSNEEFIDIVSAFYSIERPEAETPAVIIKMRIMYAIAKTKHYDASRVFAMIPQTWRDFAILFVPKPHHLLDGLVSIISDLADAPHIAAQLVIVGCKLLHQLGLEEIEVTSLPLRVNYASRAPRLPAWVESFQYLVTPANMDELVKRKVGVSLASALGGLRIPMHQLIPPLVEP